MSDVMYCYIKEMISNKDDNHVNPSMCDRCDYYAVCQGKAATELTAEIIEKYHLA